MEDTMNLRTRFSALAFLAFLVLCDFQGPLLDAQSTFGSVRGSVTDQTGAALPSAQVTLHSLDENTDVAVVGDGEGNFVFENLKPGHYKITRLRKASQMRLSTK